jgi:UPF0755 protein
MRKQTFAFLLIVLLIIALVLGSMWRNFLETPVIAANQAPLDYVLKPGSSVITLAYDLHKRGLIEHPVFLILHACGKGVARKLKAGEYIFVPGTTPTQLLDQMAAGKVVYHRFTLIEGWTFKQLLSALNRDQSITHILNTTNPTEIMDKLGVPPRNPEGLFLPNTYLYTLGVTDVAILKMAYRAMSNALATAWQQRAAGLPYKTPYDALIVASLIEKETHQANERPVVAGVILRRLQNNMPLQIDSTLIYGLGDDYNGKLDRVGLQQDTLYNTYLRRGLPPTPIAMPSLQSLQAALHPDSSNALYFVAKGDGTHQFSDTLQAQSQAVTVYQIKMNFPKVGKKLNMRTCDRPWYLSDALQSLVGSRC